MSSEDFFARNIIITGFPQNVTSEKRDRFLKHLEGKFATVLGHSNFIVTLLTDRQRNVVSGAFLTCVTEADAQAALAKLHMMRFTQADVLQTYPWSAMQNVTVDDGPYVPPELPEHEEAELDFGHNMAEDPDARPQFLVKGAKSLDCEWYWFDWERGQPQIYRRPRVLGKDALQKWSEVDRNAKALNPGLVSSLQYVVRPLPVWSTFGTMVISQQTRGLRVWGGRDMHVLFEISSYVGAFMVSPFEKFLVVKGTNNISLYNIRTAKRIRTLGNLDLNRADGWPITRFSADDTLVAVCKSGYDVSNPKAHEMGKLHIYDSETMRLLQGNTKVPAAYTFAIPGLYKAEWNPVVAGQMAYASFPEVNQGWRVVIANIGIDEDEICTEHILVQRNFMQAERLDMLWHPAGTYLSVKVTRKQNTEFYLFHVTGRNVPAFQLRVKQGFTATRFAWQPDGNYFALIIEQEGVTQLGETAILMIYAIQNNQLKLLSSVNTSTRSIFWSPKGANLVVANFNKFILQFISISQHNTVHEVKKITDIAISDAQWDPTGRYFAVWMSTIENAGSSGHYTIFDIHGNKLYRTESKTFSHFCWRPLPPSMLSPSEVRNVRDSSKTLLEEYETIRIKKVEEEQKRVEDHRKEMERTYLKKMNDIAQKVREQHIIKKRKDLENSSRWLRYWNLRLKALPEDERKTHETIVEERVVKRVPVNLSASA